MRRVAGPRLTGSFHEKSKLQTIKENKVLRHNKEILSGASRISGFSK